MFNLTTLIRLISKENMLVQVARFAFTGITTILVCSSSGSQPSFVEHSISGYMEDIVIGLSKMIEREV